MLLQSLFLPFRSGFQVNKQSPIKMKNRPEFFCRQWFYLVKYFSIQSYGPEGHICLNRKEILQVKSCCNLHRLKHITSIKRIKIQTQWKLIFLQQQRATVQSDQNIPNILAPHVWTFQQSISSPGITEPLPLDWRRGCEPFLCMTAYEVNTRRYPLHCIYSLVWSCVPLYDCPPSGHLP